MPGIPAAPDGDRAGSGLGQGSQRGGRRCLFCDEPANHPDGSINVLRRNGAMGALKPNDPDYAKALQTTKGK